MMRIRKALLEAIGRHGEKTYPHECCGFLLGQLEEGRFTVEALWPVENAREAPARSRRYLITPEDYLEAQAEAAQQGLEIIGTYHSHPDHPARPSATDLAEATFPDFLYVIVSVEQGVAGTLTAWKLSETRTTFEPVHLNIEEEAS